MIETHFVFDNIRLTLAEDIDDSQTSFDVEEGDGDLITSVPAWTRTDGKTEQMEITDVSTDTLTVVREVNGTTATSHKAGVKLDVDVVAAQTTEIHNAIIESYAIMSQMSGGGDFVLRDAQEPTFFEVIAQAAPDMSVRIRAGMGFVSALGVRTTDNTDTAVIVAPVGNPRIDIVQISKFNIITIKTGSEAGSPSAPAVDSDNLLLAEIFARVGMTSIKDADDASNGFITDARVYRGA